MADYQFMILRRVYSIQHTHSLSNWSTQTFQFSSLIKTTLVHHMGIYTWITLTRIIWFIAHQLNVRERTLEDAFSRKEINMLLFAQLRSPRKEDHSTFLFTSIKHFVMLISREYSTQVIWTLLKMKFFHISFLKRLKKLWIKLLFGRSNLSRSLLSIWWLMRILVPKCEQGSSKIKMDFAKSRARKLKNLMSNEALAEQRAKFRLTKLNI